MQFRKMNIALGCTLLLCALGCERRSQSRSSETESAEAQVPRKTEFCPDFTSSEDFKTVEEKLGPFHGKVMSSAVSMDGCHLAYVAREGNRQFVVMDGAPGPEFDAIVEIAPSRCILLSKDGEHVTYMAKRADKRFVVVDGKTRGVPTGSVSRLFLTPDGKHVAYIDMTAMPFQFILDGEPLLDLPGFQPTRLLSASIAFSPGPTRVAYIAGPHQQMVVVDGEPGPKFDWIGNGLGNHRAYRIDPPVVFSPNGKRVAYVAGVRRQQVLVLDGQRFDEFEPVANPVFSPDSGRVAFAAQKGTKQVMVVANRAGVPYDSVYGPFFAPIGERFAYIGKEGHKSFMVVDGKAGPGYERVGIPVFSPDGRRVAYVGTTGGGSTTVVVDGREDPTYDSASRPRFSPDGEKYAYIARKGGRSFAVVDGKPQPAGYVYGLRFSPVGHRLAYVRQAFNRQRSPRKFIGLTVIIDGTASPAYQDVCGHRAIFSPNGEHVAYGVNDSGTGFVVIDGKPGPKFDKVEEVNPVNGSPARSRDGVIFSPDGMRIAYTARKDGKVFVVINGWTGPPYDRIIKNGPVFHEDGVLEYLAVKEAHLFRVKHFLPETRRPEP